MLFFGYVHWYLVIAALIILFLMFIPKLRNVVTKKFKNLNFRGLLLLSIGVILQLLIVTLIYFLELRNLSHVVTLAQAITYTGAANLALFVSITPGAIGFRESFLLFSQRLHHISPNDIIAANILDRSIYLILLTILGIYILVTQTKKRLLK
ncbi:MAG: hypothetical protein NVS1B10_07190 [Candidatus Saccharimonadales bacterium]